MDIAYFLGELFLSLSTDRPTRRKRRSVAEIKAEADERFAASAPRAAARMAWQEIWSKLSELAGRHGIEADGQTPTATIEQLQRMGALDADFAGVLQSLAANFEPQAEANLSVADAQAIRMLAKQFAKRIGAL